MNQNKFGNKYRVRGTPNLTIPQLGATKNQVLELSPDEVSSKMTFPSNPTARIF